MSRLILARLVQLPIILGVIFFVTFTMVWVLPGNPLELPEGKRPPAEVQEAMLRAYHMDSPWSFLKSYVTGLAVGASGHAPPYFGPSLQYRDQSVNDILLNGLPVSAALGAAAMFVSLVLGLSAGVIGALWPGSWLDRGSLAVALAGVSLPSFVVASLLLVIFGGLLHLMPIGGWGRAEHFVLPAITLGLGPAAYIARLIRLGLADVMASDYVRTALAKGRSRSGALFHHAFKIAFLPVLSFLGPTAALVATGSFVVEKVFNIPGMGEHFVNAVLNKDQFLVLGVVLVYATLLVVFNLVVDVSYAWFDPRIEIA
ncbi:MAG: ABC transporter permease subunit [Phycisphaera sp.]|nr:ABC transporter permease subunit [Phycisphaera sp.]